MNANEQTHPARSVDFLSRLHDGELDAGERARFESHRAHCSECRRAVVEFDDAISLFRSTRSSPPRSDLAARILRKVQSTNRTRTPFPRRFQLDLGWAGLLLTALFAVLITTQIVARKNPTVTSHSPSSPAPATPPPISVHLPPPKIVAEPPESSKPARDEKESLANAGPAVRPPSREEAPAKGAVVVAPKSEVDAAQPLPRSEPLDSGKAPARAAPAAPGATSAGRERDVPARAVPAPALLVSVREADGFGAPPRLLDPSSMTLPPEERGREYIVLVDSQGIVREVAPQRATSGAISRMRFEPGPRPRRLVIRFE